MIKSISQIDPSTELGRLLMAALVIISTESQRDKEPDEVLAFVSNHAEKMYSK